MKVLLFWLFHWWREISESGEHYNNAMLIKILLCCFCVYSSPIIAAQTLLELNVANRYCGTGYGVYSNSFKGIHTGQDYCDNLDTSLESLSFGKVVFRYDMPTTTTGDQSSGKPDHGMGNVVEIEHLLSTGEKIVASYNHLNSIAIGRSEFASKKQAIGYMGHSGQQSLDYYSAIHLHFETKLTERTFDNNGLSSPWGYVRNSSSDTPKACLTSQNPDDCGFRDPDNYLDHAHVLLPYLSWSPNPSANSYSVFGYEKKPLYSSLVLNRVNEATFNKVGILGQSADFTSRNSLGDLTNAEGKWLVQRENLVVGANTEVNENHSSFNYDSRMYAFSASVNKTGTEEHTGYPIIFNILKENELIVDNDQLVQQPGENRDQTEFTASDKYYSTVPGYFLSAGLLLGKSDKIVKWQPKRRGMFEIKVNIPEIPATDGKTAATSVRYKIITKDANGNVTQVAVTDSVDHSRPGWQPLKVNNNSLFFFGKNTYVSLDLSSTYVANNWNNVSENQTNVVNVATNQFVAVDAIKFKGTDDDITLIEKSLCVTNEIARSIYRNYMTEDPTSIGNVTVQHNSISQLSQYTKNGLTITINWVSGIISNPNQSSTCPSNNNTASVTSPTTSVANVITTTCTADLIHNVYQKKVFYCAAQPKSDDGKSPYMHVVTIDRTGDYELKLMANDSVAFPGQFQLETVKQLAATHNPQSIVAINGFTFQGNNSAWYPCPLGSNRDDGAYPTTTLIMDGVLKYKTPANETILGFNKDVMTNKVGLSLYPSTTNLDVFSGNTGAGVFKDEFGVSYKDATSYFDLFDTKNIARASTASTTSKPNSPLKWAFGSTSTLMRDGKCLNPTCEPDGNTCTGGSAHISAIGYSDTKIAFVSSDQENEKVDNIQEICDTFATQGITDAVMLDGGSASNLVIKDTSMNHPNTGYCYGDDGRYIAYAIGLVPTTPISTSLQPTTCLRSADPYNKYLSYQTGSLKVITPELRDGNASHGLSPAEIIYYSAKENAINPLLLLAKLQQEQSLLTQGENYSNDAGDFESRLLKAMGVGIKDSGANDTWFGFYPQVVASSYEWYKSRERNQTLEQAMQEYTSNPKSYQEIVNFYADYAKKINQIAGTNYLAYPTDKLGYYNDFRDITAAHIQKFLELGDYSHGALKNTSLFKGLPVKNSQVVYTCGDPATTPIVPVQVIQPKPITIHTLNKQNGNIQILGTNLGASGTVTVDDAVTQGEWAIDGITLNVGMTQQSIVQPLKIKVVDSTGKETANICYPFIDVCPKTWIARPITHLWKQNMVTGYGDKQWEGYFRPFESASRAEFIAALIKTLEPGKTFVTPATDPFADVSTKHLYAPFIQRAKELGLIQGCDTTNNLFCPDKAITRAEAPKVLVFAYPDLKQLAIEYQQGKAPNKIYLDVTDKQQWYYPYIYALQAAHIAQGYQDARIAQGYKDVTFQPNSTLKRAEMAQMLCIAKFGVMACTDMGDTATKVLVLTVSPYKAQLNQSTIFTVHGINLAETMSLSVQDCSNITRLSHASDKQTYQCTPTLIGSKTAKMTDSTGNLLYSNNIQVEGIVAPVTLPGDTSTPPTTVTPPANCTPAVTDVSPLTATLNQATTFTVNGSCLSDTTSFFIDECPGQGANQVTVQAAGGSATQRQFVCTPSYKTGSHSGVVKNQAGGNTLLTFNVDYVSTSTTVVTPPAATPPVSCSPTATSVTPLTATLGQATTFTVNGSCLSDTTAFYIDECAGQVNLGGTAQQRQFSCTPSYKTGVHNGVVKDQTAGNQLLTFSTNYQWGTPKVDGVTPSTAKLNQLNSFIITGSSLLDTTIAWIDGCSGLQMFAGDANKRTFQCTATKAGTVSLIVKDRSGGTALYNSTVTVQ